MQNIHIQISQNAVNNLYNKINQHTQYNRHNFAVLELVEFLDEKGEFLDYKNELNEIIEEHEILGFMNTDSIKRRDEIRLICLNIFSLYYGNKNAIKINSAF